jgi:hypothetical protein
VVAAAPAQLAAPGRKRIFIYLSVLVFLMAFGSPAGGFIDIPISFILKNKLHLEAHEVAQFRLIGAIPLYLSFVFGLVRDSWNPFGMGDRGHMLLFGATTALIYLAFTLVPFTYASLLAAVTILTTSFLFVASAQSGLASSLGQRHLMSGQISAMWNIAASIPTIVALLIGGALSEILEGQSAEQTVTRFTHCGSREKCSSMSRPSCRMPRNRLTVSGVCSPIDRFIQPC